MVYGFDREKSLSLDDFTMAFIFFKTIGSVIRRFVEGVW